MANDLDTRDYVNSILSGFDHTRLSDIEQIFSEIKTIRNDLNELISNVSRIRAQNEELVNKICDNVESKRIDDFVLKSKVTEEINEFQIDRVLDYDFLRYHDNMLRIFKVVDLDYRIDVVTIKELSKKTGRVLIKGSRFEVPFTTEIKMGMSDFVRKYHLIVPQGPKVI